MAALFVLSWAAAGAGTHHPYGFPPSRHGDDVTQPAKTPQGRTTNRPPACNTLALVVAHPTCLQIVPSCMRPMLSALSFQLFFTTHPRTHRIDASPGDLHFACGQDTRLRAQICTPRRISDEKIKFSSEGASAFAAGACGDPSTGSRPENYTFARANVVIAGRVGGAAPWRRKAELTTEDCKLKAESQWPMADD
jgi:hypothetical protein